MSTRTISIILFSLVVAYGLMKATPLIRGPQINLAEVTTNADGLTHISGTAVHTETLTMDGSTLLIDSNGRFTKDLMLPRGSVILRLSATDRFGRSRSLERMVVTP